MQDYFVSVFMELFDYGVSVVEVRNDCGGYGVKPGVERVRTVSVVPPVIKDNGDLAF
jgi:hypothetical protein